MNILILFATNSGSTQLASEIVAETLRKHTHTVTVKMPSEIVFDDLKQYEIVIMGSPSWDYQDQQGQPHDEFRSFMGSNVGKTIDNKLFAVFGLGDSSYVHFCGAVDHLERFVSAIKGKLVVTSLRVDGFFFDQAGNEQKIRDWSEGLNTTITAGS